MLIHGVNILESQTTPAIIKQLEYLESIDVTVVYIPEYLNHKGVEILLGLATFLEKDTNRLIFNNNPFIPLTTKLLCIYLGTKAAAMPKLLSENRLKDIYITARKYRQTQYIYNPKYAYRGNANPLTRLLFETTNINEDKAILELEALVQDLKY